MDKGFCKVWHYMLNPEDIDRIEAQILIRPKQELYFSSGETRVEIRFKCKRLFINYFRKKCHLNHEILLSNL